MTTIEPIKIEGLREFQRGLKQLDADLPKALRVALNGVIETVVADARTKIPHRTGKAAASLKTQSTQTQARIKAGGNRAPYFGWLDFGGNTGRGRQVEGTGRNRHITRRGNVNRQFRKQGRYVWFSFSQNRDEILTSLQDAIADVAKQAGVEVTQSG